MKNKEQSGSSNGSVSNEKRGCCRSNNLLTIITLSKLYHFDSRLWAFTLDKLAAYLLTIFIGHSQDVKACTDLIQVQDYGIGALEGIVLLLYNLLSGHAVDFKRVSKLFQLVEL